MTSWVVGARGPTVGPLVALTLAWAAALTGAGQVFDVIGASAEGVPIQGGTDERATSTPPRTEPSPTATPTRRVGTDPLGLAGPGVLFVDQFNAACSDAHTRAQANAAATPWCTWAPALSKATAGDTIYVRCGDAATSCTYRSAHRSSSAKGTMCSVSTAVSGTAAAPITLRSYPGDAVTIDGRTALRDMDDDGVNEQPNWSACTHAGSTCTCGDGYSFATTDATNCRRIYYLTLRSPYAGSVDGKQGGFVRDAFQFWDGATLIPSADCQWHAEDGGTCNGGSNADGVCTTAAQCPGGSCRGNCLGANQGNAEIKDLLVGNRWMVDPNIDRFFYHRADHSAPTGSTQWLAHCWRFIQSSDGQDYWTIRDLHIRGFISRGMDLSYSGTQTVGWTMDGLDVRNIGQASCSTYRCIGGTNHYAACTGNAGCPGSSCVATRDSTGGYGLGLTGTAAPTRVQNSTLVQSTGEAVHVYVTGPCGGADGLHCGVTITNNDFYEELDPGWDGECANRGSTAPRGFAWDAVESGPGIIDAATDTVIEGNRFFDFGASNSSAVDIEGGDNEVINGNKFHLAADGTAVFADGGGYGAMNGVRISNNLIVGGQCQIELEADSFDFTIANNTIVNGHAGSCKNGGSGAISVVGVDGVYPTGLVIRNNIVANHGGKEINLCAPCLTGAVLQHNGLYDNDGATVLQWGGTAYTCSQFDTETNVPTSGDANKCADPLLRSGYRLGASSPFIAFGQDLSALFTTDLAGITRTAPWSAGAYQFVAGAPTPAP